MTSILVPNWFAIMFGLNMYGPNDSPMELMVGEAFGVPFSATIFGGSTFRTKDRSSISPGSRVLRQGISIGLISV